MAETRIVEQGGVAAVYDGPDSQQGGSDHVGNVWPLPAGWTVTVTRHFETRDEALQVLEFVAEQSEQRGETE